MVEFRQLHFFVSLSETRNFARAAEREHITQSALSQQIARLERELGVQLFERSSRGTSPTAAGEDLLAHAHGVLQRVADLRSHAASLAKGLAGSLRVGSPTYAVRSRARQRIVGAFLGMHPDVELEFSNEWSPELLRRVALGELDLSFVMLGPESPDLDLLVVQDSAAVAIVREDDELASRSSVSLADLAGRRVLVYPKTLNAWLYDQMVPSLSAAGADVAGLAESSLPAVLEQVRAGHGVPGRALGDGLRQSGHARRARRDSDDRGAGAPLPAVAGQAVRRPRAPGRRLLARGAAVRGGRGHSAGWH